MPTSNDIKDFIISKISSQYRFHKNYENALNEIFIQEDYGWLVEGLRKDTVAIDKIQEVYYEADEAYAPVIKKLHKKEHPNCPSWIDSAIFSIKVD